MTPLDVARPLAAFRQAVAARLGLQFDDDKLDVLAEVAAQRLAATGESDLDRYASRVEAGDADELRVLAERLTVGETYFFRAPADLDAFVGAVLADRVRARAGERRLRVLSAACASGEEPYTLAMLLSGVPELAGWDVAVQAFDVNPAAVARAVRGRYGAWSLRQTSAEATARFFVPDGKSFLVEERVRALVAFEERNLLDDDPRFWRRGAFDVVFCRNALMYLAPEVTRRVVARIAGSLAPGGYLFLGHAETLRGVSTDFHLCQGEGTFYYQLKEGSEARGADLAARPPAAAPPADAGWYDEIGRSARRIAALAETPPPSPHPPWRAEGDPSGLPLAAGGVRGDPVAPAFPLALELLREERFGDALAALGAPEADADADALLLRAVLLASRGDVDAAERVCARILERDELDAVAHYVTALCRERAGDRAGAARHDAYALYLDPAFAMPRLHLGLMARRAGDAAAARRELSRALVMLGAEDASRVLLLGGGFGRAALVELCRAELRACGGRP